MLQHLSALFSFDSFGCCSVHHKHGFPMDVGVLQQHLSTLVFRLLWLLQYSLQAWLSYGWWRAATTSLGTLLTPLASAVFTAKIGSPMDVGALQHHLSARFSSDSVGCFSICCKHGFPMDVGMLQQHLSTLFSFDSFGCCSICHKHGFPMDVWSSRPIDSHPHRVP